MANAQNVSILNRLLPTTAATAVVGVLGDVSLHGEMGGLMLTGNAARDGLIGELSLLAPNGEGAKLLVVRFNPAGGPRLTPGTGEVARDRS